MGDRKDGPVAAVRIIDRLGVVLATRILTENGVMGIYCLLAVSTHQVAVKTA